MGLCSVTKLQTHTHNLNHPRTHLYSGPTFSPFLLPTLPLSFLRFAEGSARSVRAPAVDPLIPQGNKGGSVHGRCGEKPILSGMVRGLLFILLPNMTADGPHASLLSYR